jgi:hypothetical protein
MGLSTHKKGEREQDRGSEHVGKKFLTDARSFGGVLLDSCRLGGDMSSLRAYAW